MGAPCFIVSDGAVWWLGPSPVRLTSEAVEGLLVIFEREGADDAFVELFDARCAAMGGIPVLRPITATVRQLDPAIWGDALTSADVA